MESSNKWCSEQETNKWAARAEVQAALLISYRSTRQFVSQEIKNLQFLFMAIQFGLFDSVKSNDLGNNLRMSEYLLFLNRKKEIVLFFIVCPY